MATPSTLLVTGGAGFIGSHVVDRLLRLGHRVVIIDDLRAGSRANLAQWLEGRPDVPPPHSRLTLLVNDVAEGVFAPLASFTREHGPIDRVVHLAAQVSVDASIRDPLADVQVNYGSTVHILEYARAQRVKKVVFASSAAVYGDTSSPPVAEDARCAPVSPYGVHKLASEKILSCYCALHKVPTTALRLFNVYGPRQRPTSPYSSVVSIFADRVRAGRPLTVFGDGEQTRDFVYVEDVARAVVDAVLGDAGDGDVFNIATGRETSVNQLASTIMQASERQCPILHAEQRKGEINRSAASVEKAFRVLSFRAETPLVDGLRATLAEAGSSP